MSESIERVVRELKKPVVASPDLDARVMTRVLAESRTVSPARRSWRWSALALAAGLAMVVLVPRGRRVAFTFQAPQASSVAVVGDFNDWKPALLTRTGSAWEIRVRLPPGQYNYAFVVDGSRWVADPAAPKNTVDDFGSPNSVVTVVL